MTGEAASALSPEAIATLITGIGGIVAATFGVYRASKAPGPSRTPEAIGSIDERTVHYLHAMRDELSDAVRLVEQIRDATEMQTRAVDRIERSQGDTMRRDGDSRANQEIQVEILKQIREVVKGLFAQIEQLRRVLDR